MEKYKGKTGLYVVRIEKIVTFTPSEGDVQSYPETETKHVLVKNFENFLIYLHGVNINPDVVAVNYVKLDNSVLTL